MEENVPLAPYTTVRLGGRARYFARCRTSEELKAALSFARGKGLPVHVLGGGSNTVFADAGYSGLVVKNNLTGIDWRAGGLVRAAAGERWDALVEQCVKRGWAGLECLSGIPGSVGAAPVQNAGAYGRQASDFITEVKALDTEKLTEVSLAAGQCGFGYRRSRFKEEDKGRYLITEAAFQLRPGGKADIRYEQLARAAGDNPSLSRARRAVMELRRAKSALALPDDPHARSCGSFFLNPVITRAKFKELTDRHGHIPCFEAGEKVKIPAAWLVEQAGFEKGYRRAGAGVSPRHALALVNYGGTAEELLALAEEIQAAVKDKFGLQLEREPVVVPAA